jgi:hypothetical protein
MNKEFIPYEQALALKELGFEEPCIALYFINKEEIIYSEEGGFWYNSNSEEDRISAPLYQQAFRWLLALANKDKLFSNKWTISYNEDYYSLFLGGCNMGVFYAELECLKKLIEIVKNK